MHTSVSEIEKEIKVYEAERERFLEIGNKEAAKVFDEDVGMLKRKLELIKREGIWTP